MTKKSKHYWNYRVVARAHEVPKHLWKKGVKRYWKDVGIYEVHYEGKKPVAITEKPVNISADDVEGLRWMLKVMKKALKRPVLRYEDF